MESTSLFNKNYASVRGFIFVFFVLFFFVLFFVFFCFVFFVLFVLFYFSPFILFSGRPQRTPQSVQDKFESLDKRLFLD